MRHSRHERHRRYKRYERHDPAVIPLAFKTDLNPTASTELGSSLRLSVEVQDGVSPYTYAWTKDGAAVAEGLDGSASYLKDTTVAGDAGNYQCSVTDSAGTKLNSKVCTVTITPVA